MYAMWHWLCREDIIKVTKCFLVETEYTFFQKAMTLIIAGITYTHKT